MINRQSLLWLLIILAATTVVFVYVTRVRHCGPRHNSPHIEQAQVLELREELLPEQ